MSRAFKIFFILLLLGLELQATHILGGRIQLAHVSGMTYDITIIGYRDHGSNIAFGSGVLDFGDGTNINQFEGFEEKNLGEQHLVFFTVRHTYLSPSRYTISYSEDFRSDDLVNLADPAGSIFYIESALLIDPIVVNQPFILSEFESVQVISGQIFQNSFCINDNEGDIMEFSLSLPSISGNAYAMNYQMPDDPSFYNGLDGFISFNKLNGSLEWLAPDVPGLYLLNFEVKEKRLIDGNYVILSSQLIDLVLDVKPNADERLVFLQVSESSCGNDITLNVDYQGDYQLDMSLDYLESINGTDPVLFLNQQYNGSQSLEIELKGLEETSYRLLRVVILIDQRPLLSASVALNEDCELFENLVILSTPIRSNIETISIFPNPATDKISLRYGGKVTSVRLIDLTGKEIYHLNVGLFSEEILLPSLESGLYLVQLFNENLRLIGESKLKVVQ